MLGGCVGCSLISGLWLAAHPVAECLDHDMFMSEMCCWGCCACYLVYIRKVCVFACLTCLSLIEDGAWRMCTGTMVCFPLVACLCSRSGRTLF